MPEDTPRRVILKLLKDYSDAFCFKISLEYVENLSLSDSDKLTNKEFNNFLKCVKRDISDYAESKRNLHPSLDALDHYINPYETDCIAKIDLLTNKYLNPTTDFESLKHILYGNPSVGYEKMLRGINIDILNNERIENTEYYQIVVILGCITLLFGEKVLNDDPENDERKLGNELRIFDHLFKNQSKQDNLDQILYHIKNAVCHGTIAFDGKSLYFQDRDEYLNKVDSFIIEKNDLINGFIESFEIIVPTTKKMQPLFNESLQDVKEIQVGNAPSYSSPTILGRIIDFLMIYEKIKVAAGIAGYPLDKKKHLRDLLNLYKIKISATDIRKSFSHGMDYDGVLGKFIISPSNVDIGFWDWMYASDMIRTIVYLLYCKMMLLKQDGSA